MSVGFRSPTVDNTGLTQKFGVFLNMLCDLKYFQLELPKLLVCKMLSNLLKHP